HRRDELGDRRALPPRAGLAQLPERREAIVEETRPHVPWRLPVERVSPEQPQRRSIPFQDAYEEPLEPGASVPRRDRDEPHQPVQAQVIRRDLAGQPTRVTRLALELVF